MKVVLESEGENIIRAIDMKDGQIGIITAWEVGLIPEYEYLGRIVQRFGDNLVSLGKGAGSGWQNYFNGRPLHNEDGYRVRILSLGSTLRIVEDED